MRECGSVSVVTGCAKATTEVLSASDFLAGGVPQRSMGSAPHPSPSNEVHTSVVMARFETEISLSAHELHNSAIREIPDLFFPSGWLTLWATAIRAC
eukprot:CAMPEP_0177364888 /NCGR_PEP_ID=MMETSP0368-20130122/39023_1 /TAXON_ID=447022 ORGANISM="Scrippsiella hangoei-like, Strain SHHI-4" /NCGR_SAMPLE_ID=MMETSP0368 /ASSEMBLY_ACC=CAM_ASM_000363 /LENGTH=96 /DNA_ID=CAMNT_0018827765 /DNA_START=193 /DNA_END=480 /DNA_ORIENTATION=-